MKRLVATVASLVVFAATVARAATVIAIDIDSTRTGGSTTTGGSVFTTAGWTSLDVTTPDTANGASVVVEGITFSIASADSSRVRLTAGLTNPNDLTADFAYDDGANQAVILLFGSAGASLPAGQWQAEVWAWDAGVASFETNVMSIGWRQNGVETIPAPSAVPDPVNPAATFTFTSDGTSAYDVFVRENSAGDRARINAVRLTQVPEPAAASLLALCLGALAARRRR